MESTALCWMDQRLGRGGKDIRQEIGTQEKRAGMSQVNFFSRTQAPVGVWRDGTMSCNSLNVKD